MMFRPRSYSLLVLKNIMDIVQNIFLLIKPLPPCPLYPYVGQCLGTRETLHFEFIRSTGTSLLLANSS